MSDNAKEFSKESVERDLKTLLANRAKHSVSAVSSDSFANRKEALGDIGLSITGVEAERTLKSLEEQFFTIFVDDEKIP